MLETIHKYVLALDRYYECVCELDIIYGFDQAFYILDEFIMAGEVQETSTRLILKHIYDQNVLEKAEVRRSPRLGGAVTNASYRRGRRLVWQLSCPKRPVLVDKTSLLAYK